MHSCGGDLDAADQYRGLVGRHLRRVAMARCPLAMPGPACPSAPSPPSPPTAASPHRTAPEPHEVERSDGHGAGVSLSHWTASRTVAIDAAGDECDSARATVRVASNGPAAMR
jgi:hypothetical protein